MLVWRRARDLPPGDDLRHGRNSPGSLGWAFQTGPSFTALANMDWQNCVNNESLGAVLSRHPQVIRLPCGHVHRPIHTAWHGVAAGIATGPSHSCVLDLNDPAPHDFVLEPPTCALHSWSEGAGLVSHLLFIGDHGRRHPFYGKDRMLID